MIAHTATTDMGLEGKVYREIKRTKVQNGTSKICPHCRTEATDTEGKIERKRKREYILEGPYTKRECLPLKTHPPRRHMKFAWWIGLGYLFGHTADLPWFKCSAYATCPSCGREEVKELHYARQFCRFRLILMCMSKQISWKWLGFWFRQNG